MHTFFLAINARGTSSGGGGSGDGSSGGRGVRAAVGSSGGVGVAVSSVRVCGSRGQWPGARWGWMEGSQHACGNRKQMRHACDSVQRREHVCMQQCALAAACVRQWAWAVGSMIAMGDSDGSSQLAAQLQWAAAAVAQRMVRRRQDRDGQWQRRWANVG
jgi:hypothetical protein